MDERTIEPPEPQNSVEWMLVLKDERDRVNALKAAIIRINRTPLYEERGKPESGISTAFLRAVRDAVVLAENDQ